MTSDGTTPIGANCAVVSAPHKGAGGNFLKRVSTVSAELEHPPVEANIGINIGRFEVEVVPK
jgi:hypothetical protein